MGFRGSWGFVVLGPEFKDLGFSFGIKGFRRTSICRKDSSTRAGKSIWS